VKADDTLTAARLDAVAAEHGASFYLADIERFAGSYRRFEAAFRAIYPRTRIGYSYKTNYLPAFIRRAHALGAYSEVVSRFEFAYARELGIPGERIIFNGPVKASPELADAFGAGALVNADSVAEINQMIRVAEELPGGPVAIGLRCFLGPETEGSRFGIDLGGREGDEALAALAGTDSLRLAGLHCHQSGDRSAEQYRQRTKAMLALHTGLLEGRPLDFIDLGGGFASTMGPSLLAQLRYTPATFEDYAEAVAGEMAATYGADGPELILEPGMALLADTMVLVTRVETVKELGGRRLAVVDASILNTQPFQDGRVNLPVRVVPTGHQRPPSTGPWEIVGHTCTEIDVLHRGHRGPLGIGDYVVVENVGAYTTVLNAPFIRGRPAIVELGPSGPGDVLRPRSTALDLLQSYEP